MTTPAESFTTANMDFAAGGNEGYVREIATWGSVMMLQEAKDFTLADKLPGSWKSLQNTSTDAKAGSCLAFDTDVWRLEDHWLTKACDEVQGADGMLARYIQTAILTHRESGKVANPMSCHAPPPRFQDQRLDQFATNLRKAIGQVGKPIIGMDANFDVKDVTDKAGLQVFHVQTIIWVATNLRHLKSTYRGWGPDHGASDHPGLTVKLELVKT
jgi:hypothetical protein